MLVLPFRKKTYPNIKSEDKFHSDLSIQRGRETWDYDNVSEFYSDYQNDFYYANLRFYAAFEAKIEIFVYGLEMLYSNIVTKVSVKDKKRENIESIFSIFDDAAEDSHIPEPSIKSSKLPESPPKPWEKRVVIFIGHGQDDVWRDRRTTYMICINSK